MTIDRDRILSLFNLHELPLCERGMNLAERYLENCLRSVEQLDSDGASMHPSIEAWNILLEHRDHCESCSGVQIAA